MTPSTLVPLSKADSTIKIPHLGFGCMGLSREDYGPVPSDEERFRVLDRAHELGCTHWDSSDLYADSEELIGKWFKRTGKRSDIFLASKFGFVKGGTGFPKLNSTGKYAKEACEESLRILGIDYIDLYYMHHANPETPIEETMRALAELKAEGKIKHIGLSSISGATLRRAVKVAPVSAVQTDYSPFVRKIESSEGTDLLATARELGVSIVAAMPLNRGLLTPTFTNTDPKTGIKDMRSRMMPRFMEGNREKNLATVNQYQTLADKLGYTMPQLSLAWLMKQGDDIIPIPGTKNVQYLEENWKAMEIKLTDAQEATVRKFLETAEVAGDVVPPAFKSWLFVTTKEEQ